MTAVDGTLLTTLGKTLFEFVIDFQIFPFEGHGIKDLAYDVIVRRNFSLKCCFKIVLRMEL